MASDSLRPATKPPAGYEAAFESAAMFDLSCRSRLLMTGPDRRNFLHNFCTNEIRGLTDQTACEAFLLNVKGRILGHILVIADEDRLWIESAAGQAAPIMQHLEKYHLLEDFQLSDQSSGTEELLVTGPNAVARLFESGLDVAGLDAFQNRRLTWSLTGQTIEVLAQRFDMLNQPGFLLITSASAASLAEHLSAAGLAAGSAETFEALRIEAGFPVYGTDLSDDNLAQEARRTDRAISFTKGCYLGQEPVARIHALGHVNRELRILTLSGETSPPVGTPLFDPDKPEKGIGQLSSVTWSWQRECPVGLAMIRRQFATPGTRILVGTEPASTAVVVDPASEP